MNPLPMVRACLARNRATALLFVVLIALAVALGIAISAQERALRLGSARAADRFDLIVAAPGSHNDVLFSVVYLRPTGVELLPKEMVAKVLADSRTEFAAPIGFGDHYGDAQVVGTTAPFVEHLGGVSEGRAFARIDEAVVGALSSLKLGEEISIGHGHAGAGGTDADDAAEAEEADSHQGSLGVGGEKHMAVHVVGRMQPTGTPWDRAIVVPIEYNWQVHGLGTGHALGDEAIGPPFDPKRLPGVPAIVVKPASLAAAYGLRDVYRSMASTAFFPAEVLVEIYDVMGNVAGIMAALTVAAQTLVVAAILAGVVALLDLQRQRFAVLRALGAPARFVFLVVWIYVTALIGIGALVGLPLGWGAAAVVSSLVAATTGVSMTATIGATELGLVALLLVLGMALSLLPALLIYRQPVVDGLRG